MLPDKGLYVLFCALGVSAWVAINGVFQELPILAATQPEGWDIGAYLSATIQLANVFVVAEAYAVRRFQLSPIFLMYVLLVTGIIAMLWLSIQWDTIAFVFGAPRSVPLLLLTFVAGAVDCTTSVVYWPMVSTFADIYTSALGVGEALSGTSVGLVGLLQDPSGQPPRFGASLFFIAMAVITTLSLLAFIAIHRYYLVNTDNACDQQEALCDDSDDSPKEPPLHWRRLGRPLTTLAAVNFLQNGVLPSLLSYAFLKYPQGNDWLANYLIAYLIVTPLPPALAAILHIRSAEVPLVICLGLTSYMVWVAASAHPPLAASPAGGQVMMAVLLLNQILMMYLKTYLFLVLKAAVSPAHHPQVYKYGGYAIQLGSCLGAFSMLLLVSVFKVFSQ